MSTYAQGAHTATRGGEHLVVVDQPTEDTVRVRFDSGREDVLKTYAVHQDLHKAIRHHIVTVFELLMYVPEGSDEWEQARATLTTYEAQRMLPGARDHAAWRAAEAATRQAATA